MTRKTQRIVYGLFVLGICIAFSAAMAIGTGMYGQCNNQKESGCDCSCRRDTTHKELKK
jgi:hypothetical protein